MFDPSTLPKLKVVPGKLNSATVILKDSTYSLLVDGTRWMTYNDKSNIQAKELYSSYDLAYGKVICSGLGFGLLPLWISQKVDSVTVYEKSQDVIDLFLQNNEVPSNMEIICQNINTVTATCDCLLLDHYEFDTTYEKITNMQSLKIEHTLIWPWSMERMLLQTLPISQGYLYGMELARNPIDFGEAWEKFRFMDTLPSLSREKINEYVYTYLDKVGYTL